MVLDYIFPWNHDLHLEFYLRSQRVAVEQMFGTLNMIRADVPGKSKIFAIIV